MAAALSTATKDATALYAEHCRAAVVDALLDALPRATAIRLASEAAAPLAASRRWPRRGPAPKNLAGFVARLYFAFRYETPAEIADVAAEVFHALRGRVSRGCAAEVAEALPPELRVIWSWRPHARRRVDAVRH